MRHVKVEHPELYATHVAPEAMSAEDWQLLLAADAAGPAYQSIPPERIAKELQQGTMMLFRLRPQRGLLLVECRTGATGLRRLGVVRSAGTGLGFLARQIAEVLKHIAREWGCQQVETMVYSPRLAEAMKLVGAKAEAVNMVLEVE